MSQTTFAILALATAMLIAVAQIRWTVQTQQRLVDDELEVMASGVARQVLEYSETRSFDERTTPAVWNVSGAPFSELDFDLAANFGNAPDPVCNLSDLTLNLAECDDIDDLHMDSTTWQSFPFIMETDTMEFEVNVQVYYVDDVDPDIRLLGGSRSRSKEMIVRVRSPLQVQQHRFTEGLVQLKRLFPYDETDEEDRYNYVYGISP
ncbi:MAG: hypothetical protein KTR29_00015 [Rhodothermaceae bacterium]|nr:hypothetical protein [Rhodothermaceae bacterium]